MYKAFGFLFVLILFSSSSGQSIGQVTRPASETSTQAKRLLQEGIDLTRAGQFVQAIRALEEAIKLDPNSAEANAALGRTYFKMRLWQRAADYLKRASALKAKQQQDLQIAAAKDSAVVTPKLTEQQAIASSATAPVVTQPEKAPEVTQPEKPPEQATPNSGAAKAPEETPEPTGVNVSMSASPASSVTPIPLAPSNEDISLTKIYRVGPGDVLDIRINEAEPRQSTLFTVTPAGQLEHPILADPLSVSSLTTEEIETKFEDDLKKRALIENPEVTVGVRDYASHSILVSGLVKESGTKFLRREAIPLYVVVADAQPLPEAAKVTVVRNEQKQMFEIDLTKVADMNLLVRPGDVINLQRNEAQFVYVGGEVKDPGEKIFRRGLTLTQAIISAGGVTPKSKAAEISRDDGQGFLVKTSFKLKDIQTGKTIDPLIQPGDRIMILR